MALHAERELTQWTAEIDVKRPFPIGESDIAVGEFLPF